MVNFTVQSSAMELAHVFLQCVLGGMKAIFFDHVKLTCSVWRPVFARNSVRPTRVTHPKISFIFESIWESDCRFGCLRLRCQRCRCYWIHDGCNTYMKVGARAKIMWSVAPLFYFLDIQGTNQNISFCLLPPELSFLTPVHPLEWTNISTLFIHQEPHVCRTEFACTSLDI